MDNKEAQQKIAALKAIIQTLMPELYWTQAEGGAQANFGALVEDDDPVATAIANELTEPEIDEGFAWVDRARGSTEAEMRATPIVPFLNPRTDGADADQARGDRQTGKGSDHKARESLWIGMRTTVMLASASTDHARGKPR